MPPSNHHSGQNVGHENPVKSGLTIRMEQRKKPSQKSAGQQEDTEKKPEITRPINHNLPPVSPADAPKDNPITAFPTATQAHPSTAEETGSRQTSVLSTPEPTNTLPPPATVLDAQKQLKISSLTISHPGPKPPPVTDATHERNQPPNPVSAAAHPASLPAEAHATHATVALAKPSQPVSHISPLESLAQEASQPKSANLLQTEKTVEMPDRAPKTADLSHKTPLPIRGTAGALLPKTSSPEVQNSPEGDPKKAATPLPEPLAPPREKPAKPENVAVVLPQPEADKTLMPPVTATPIPLAKPPTLVASQPEKSPDLGGWVPVQMPELESLQALLEPNPEVVARLKQGDKLHRFLAQSVVLEESGLSKQVRSALLVVAAVIITFFVWASFSSIDEMAAAIGEVMPASPVQLVQHFEGGIVRKILVKEGQVIQKGGVLVQLDTEAAQADLNQAWARKASLQVQEIRIRAFLSGENADFSQINPEFSGSITGQIRLLQAQRTSLESQKMVLQTRIDRARSRTENLIAQQESFQRQLTVLGQELGIRQQGLAKGLMSKLAVLTTQREYRNLESEQVRIRGEMTTARKDLEEAMGALTELNDNSRETALRELSSVSNDLAQIAEQVSRLQDRFKRLDIGSPVWGVVKDLHVKTLGGVVAPGGVVAEIIPIDQTRRVDIRISTLDIGHVAIGQSVTVKVGAYDYARYGGINGILENISASTFTEPTAREPYYRGVVRLDRAYVGSNENLNPVLPGMTVQASIHTGAKTLMEYMLKPIVSSVNQSFRER